MKAAGLKRRLLDWIAWERDGFDNAGGSPRGMPLPDYTVYRLSLSEYAASMAAGLSLSFVAFYLFYHSLAASLVLSVIGASAPRLYRSSLLEKRRIRLRLQFKEALYSLTSSLAAGRSVENAFAAAYDDLRLLYPDSKTDLLREFAIIARRLENGEPLESGLRNFAARSGIDDIIRFSDVFSTCKRSGGDLVEVIRRTSQVIGEKLEIEQDIAVMVAQKRFESRIMMAVPFLFLGFLGLAAPDYMKPLYESAAGYLLLTGALIALAGCMWIIRSVMRINV